MTDIRDAKRDLRLRVSGALTPFRFENIWFPTEPKTAFYDWLYGTALYPHREWLRNHLLKYAGFTDIEFNPERSIHCQARSCALLVKLLRNGWIDEAVSSPEGLPTGALPVERGFAGGAGNDVSGVSDRRFPSIR